MADEQANKDQNSVSSLLATNASAVTETLNVYANASTHGLLVSVAGSETGSTVTVVGNVASGATDSGNPVKIGGVYNSTQPTLTNGQRGDVQLDVRANLSSTLGTLLSGEDQTNNILAVVRKPLSVNTYAWTVSKSSAYEASRVAKASSGMVRSIIGYNSKASAQFIQLHNTASLPSDTAVPDVIITVAASSNFSIDFDEDGYYCSTGITVCNSSTGPTKTIGSADCWFVVRYF